MPPDHAHDHAPTPAQDSVPIHARTSAPAVRTTRQQARDSESVILHWLHRFGYLTAPQVAALVFKGYRQSEHFARRVLLRLVQRGFVLRRPGEPGERGYYALSQQGAHLVREVYGVPAISGKDVLRQPSLHRTLANDAAIRAIQAGWKSVWTEREIQSRAAPFHHLGKTVKEQKTKGTAEERQKVPDVIAADSNGLVTWLEVEASRRGGRDMKALARWLVYTAFPLGLGRMMPLDSPQDSLFLERVRFVLAVPQAHSFARRLSRALDALLGPLDSNVRDFAANTLEFEIPGKAVDVSFE